MAIDLPGGEASYSFQHPQKYAIQLRLTPEAKEALLRAQHKGQTGSLRLSGSASDNALTVDGQTFALHPPASQQNLDLFTKSEQGCVQIGHIHQKAVVKRSIPQAALQQPQLQAAQHQAPHQNGNRIAAVHSTGQNGYSQATAGQAVRKQHDAAVPVQHPTVVQKPAMAATHQKGLHAAMSSQASIAHRQLPSGRQPQARPPPPTFNSQPPSAHTSSAHALPQQQGQTQPPPQGAHPHQAPPGGSHQSAQTAAPVKPHTGKPGKAQAAGASAIAQSAEVLEQVCAAARKGQKEAMLVALLQCKPPKNQVLEALFKDVEKKVPGFKRLQGDSYKRACSKYAQMRSGNKWELRDTFHQEALNIVASKPLPTNPPAEPSGAQPPLGVAGTAHRSSGDVQAAAQRRPPSEPLGRVGPAQLDPQSGMDQSKKKKKRLTKAADMGTGMEKTSGAGLKRKLQTAGLTDSDSDGDAAAPNKSQKLQKGLTGLPGPTHNGVHPSATAAASAPQLNGFSGHQGQQRDQRWQDGGHPTGVARGDVAGFQGLHEGAIAGAGGRSPDVQSPVSNGDGAAAPPGIKVKIKIRRPMADDYDESWFAEHVDRNPSLRGPITNIQQWEECLREYNSKYALYFRLHQEVQNTKIKVEGLRQAAQNASSDSEKARYQQQFDLMWKKGQPRAEKWDKAFNVLDKELGALHKQLQAFHDEHAPKL